MTWPTETAIQLYQAIVKDSAKLPAAERALVLVAVAECLVHDETFGGKFGAVEEHEKEVSDARKELAKPQPDHNKAITSLDHGGGGDDVS